MTEDELKTTLRKEINAAIEQLKGKGSMTLDEALSTANEIVEKINKLVDIYAKTEDIGKKIELYELAKDAYIMAAQKVPEEDRVRVLRPSSFWSMRSDLAKVESKRPISYPVTIRKKTSRALPSREKITGLHELLGEKRPEKLEFETQNLELEFEPKALGEEYRPFYSIPKFTPFIKVRPEKLDFGTQIPERIFEPKALSEGYRPFHPTPKFKPFVKVHSEKSKKGELESKSILKSRSKLKELGGVNFI